MITVVIVVVGAVTVRIIAPYLPGNRDRITAEP